MHEILHNNAFILFSWNSLQHQKRLGMKETLREPEAELCPDPPQKNCQLMQKTLGKFQKSSFSPSKVNCSAKFR